MSAEAHGKGRVKTLPQQRLLVVTLKNAIVFGEAVEKSAGNGPLTTVRDWQQAVDVRKQLKLPEVVAQTEFGTDAVFLQAGKSLGAYRASGAL